ncbi:MAG: mechanosensitive ion channel family protein [Candidatus Nanohaloarchaea archaeon]
MEPKSFLGELFIILEQVNGSIGAYGIQIDTFTVLLALCVIFSGFLANKLSNFLVGRGVRKRSGDPHAAVTAKKLTAYIIYPLTFVAVLGVFGFPLSALGAAVGLIGLGISFALKDMIANFFSGVLILTTRPFKVGDQISVEGEAGTVQDIKVRATDVKTYDGRKVIVPNSKLYNDTVVNNTAYDERRFDVVVGIGYDDDIEKAKSKGLEALNDSEKVSDHSEPQVLVSELGDSSIKLKLRGWTKPSRASLVAASSEVTQNVKEYFDEEGIDIPYPIRTVFMEDEE